MLMAQLQVSFYLFCIAAQHDCCDVWQGKDCQLEGRKFQFLITSYNFVPKLKDQLQTLAPQVMVLDEAHCIKASKASSECQICPQHRPLWQRPSGTFTIGDTYASRRHVRHQREQT